MLKGIVDKAITANFLTIPAKHQEVLVAKVFEAEVEEISRLGNAMMKAEMNIQDLTVSIQDQDSKILARENLTTKVAKTLSAAVEEVSTEDFKVMDHQITEEEGLEGVIGKTERVKLLSPTDITDTKERIILEIPNDLSKLTPIIHLELNKWIWINP